MTWLRLSSKATRYSTFIRDPLRCEATSANYTFQAGALMHNLCSESTCLPKMLSYFRELQVTYYTSIFMRNLHSDATCPSRFFTAYQRCRTTSAKQVWSKRYIRGKQVKDKRSTVFIYLCLLPPLCSLLFSPISLG